MALDCQINNTVWTEDSLYVSCYKGTYYNYPTLAATSGVSSQESFAPQKPEDMLLKISIKNNHLQVIETMEFNG